MARNDIPSKDSDLSSWMNTFVSALAANAGTFGLLSADMAPLSDANDAFGVALADYMNKKQAIDAALGLKSMTRTDALAELRPMIQRICKHPAMNDQLRGILGLGRDGELQSATPISLIPAPSLYLESVIGQVVVHWGPTPQNERTNGKPAGVRGCNIYRRKAGEDEYQMMNFVTSSPYVDSITGPAADYEYVARYRGTKTIDLGAQSDAATVAARGQLAA